MASFCGKCGSVVADKAGFCGKCGAPVQAAGQSLQAQPAPQGVHERSESAASPANRTRS